MADGGHRPLRDPSVIPFVLAPCAFAPMPIADNPPPLHRDRAGSGDEDGHVDESPDACTRPPGVPPPSTIEPGEAESAMGIARKICELDSQHLDERTTSAIPGYTGRNNRPRVLGLSEDHRRPLASIMGQPFPSIDVIYHLLDDYFDAVHWFSLVVYEPKFRRRLQAIADGFADPAQRPFLLLLAIMLSMAAWYRSHRPSDATDSGHDWAKVGADLIKLVESNLVELMDQPSILAVQTCILFGSHHLYHGRPNLSFTLLGATIRMAQAIGLHRESQAGDFGDREERKRVWWTVYTWDRFASITYGTPLGINDKDCNLGMPVEFYEDPSFGVPRGDDGAPICYSSYQRELNRLYLIVSNALETIFGSRTSRSSQELVGDTYVTMVQQATENLHNWRRLLPSHLVLELNQDYRAGGAPSSKAHALQALSLQLSYDNILIVLHRPLIARQVNHLSTSLSPGKTELDSPADPAFPKANIASSDLWRKAAVRTARVTELPVLAQLATESHLVAFLAINLFHAAVVLAVTALSEPLSDAAQEVKRTITRILRLQDLLGKRSALSRQTTLVLKKVVAMLLRRESAAILAPLTGTSTSINAPVDFDDPPLRSVEDTLRLPLDVTFDVSDAAMRSQGAGDIPRANRLNESLNSVQHVMVPGDDCTLYLPVPGDAPRQHETSPLPDCWPLPPENAWPGPNGSAGFVPSGHDGNVENGLYWLWDTAWDGL
ncbi:C6 transcription factor [Aspergillus heteromorphus CBS 117.55]|uniref:C6 transcription factor n=1 Tax=Aspergillus heteromorphus CBS 117.55 TaxID=1448321 RepID=A0A317VF98_9EURO|nr:C6 transcription factor [Aspergillus heteromorphus CBS 117.55]PWY73053.1 C6 transcription factor [Aspergillus heteromorphus CBS 117.55]